MTKCIDSLRLVSVDATAVTTWLFVEVCLVDGTVGWGEATLDGRELEVIDAAERLFPELAGAKGERDDLYLRLPFASLPEAAVSSAVMQAFRDAETRCLNVPLATSLGGHFHDRVGLYANINRRTVDRTPEGMARSARDAGNAGFEAIKIAPFDEVSPDLDRSEMRAAMEPGLKRMAAVRDVLGPDARLMIDCHWRFDEAGADELIRAAATLAPYWIECPVIETPERIEAICRLRRIANEAGMRLAGLETQVQTRGFQPYLTAGAYDVMMPDVKYAGGPDEMMHIAALFDRYGVAFSPHNPSGPICHAHSMHVCAALPASDLLEHQFDETPAFNALIDDALPISPEGTARPDSTRHGIGVALSGDAALAQTTELLNERRSG